MAENSNSQFKMQFIDKLIVSMIGVFNVIVIVVTIVVVDNNYERKYQEQLAKLNEIPYNETYKYLTKKDSIVFYKGISEIAKYKCTENCKITKFSSTQFIIDNDSIIPIRDNNKVVLYSIEKKTDLIQLDDIPLTSINNKYGIIKMNGKDGVINKHGDITFNCIFDDIDINATHIVALSNNRIYIYDNEPKILASRQIATVGDLSISEKNNNLYINIIGNTTTTLIYDSLTNKFIK